jgi:hypothetical protein
LPKVKAVLAKLKETSFIASKPGRGIRYTREHLF